jgi:hypothetical protein
MICDYGYNTVTDLDTLRITTNTVLITTPVCLVIVAKWRLLTVQLKRICCLHIKLLASPAQSSIVPSHSELIAVFCHLTTPSDCCQSDKLLLVLASTVFLGFEFRGNHDHNLLSHWADAGLRCVALAKAT